MSIGLFWSNSAWKKTNFCGRIHGIRRYRVPFANDLCAAYTVYLCACAAWHTINTSLYGCAVGLLWVVRMLRLCPNENSNKESTASRSANEIENADRISVFTNIGIFKITIKKMHRKDILATDWHSHKKKMHSHTKKKEWFGHGRIFTHQKQCQQREFVATDRHSHNQKTMNSHTPEIIFWVTTDIHIYCNHMQATVRPPAWWLPFDTRGKTAMKDRTRVAFWV